ncbi:MAG: histidine kinase dimerization/phospho-acceptor domain-containing protein, partial [Planctomycetota bacterium]
MERQTAGGRIEAAQKRIERQEAELRARSEELDRLQRELDEFAFIVSHDLKEPLAAIRAYTEVLHDEYAERIDADGRRQLEVLSQMSDRLAASIDGLLEYCRAGRMDGFDENVDLGAVVEEVLKTFEPRLRRL